MTEREWRLRLRIDTLTDRAIRAEARAALVTPLRRRLNAVERSRDYWRHRATGR